MNFLFIVVFFSKLEKVNHAMHDAVVAYFQSRGSIIREAKTGAGRRRGGREQLTSKEPLLKLFEVVLQMINL